MMVVVYHTANLWSVNRSTIGYTIAITNTAFLAAHTSHVFGWLKALGERLEPTKHIFQNFPPDFTNRHQGRKSVVCSGSFSLPLLQVWRVETLYCYCCC